MPSSSFVVFRADGRLAPPRHPMASLLLPSNLDLIQLLRRLLLGSNHTHMVAFPSFSQTKDGLPRSESQISAISEYLDVERSKSLNSSLRKCSRTEGEKKVVCFADAMGLDLCQVKPIFPYNTSDEDILSNTPPSASNIPNLIKSQPRPQPQPSSFNCPRYLQLTGQINTVWRDPIIVQKELLLKVRELLFQARVQAKKNGVALKTSSVMGMTFSGVVAVRNYAFEKKVSVRYTIDDWRSFIDTRCHFLNSIGQEGLDLFSFSIYLPSSMPVGAKCQFCIRYECVGKDYWDNNDDNNYVLEVRSLGEVFTEKEYEQPVFY